MEEIVCFTYLWVNIDRDGMKIEIKRRTSEKYKVNGVLKRISKEG
jgi:hypothetical protein